MALLGKSFTVNDLPSAKVISKSGLKALNQLLIIPSIPLKTDKTTIKAAELTMMPIIEMKEMTLMMLCFFLENRYLKEMKRAVLCCAFFKIYCFKSLSMFSM